MIRNKKTKRTGEREKQLQVFWQGRLRKQLSAALSDFGAVYERATSSHKPDLTDVSWRVLQGRPLTFAEYHTAIADGILITELPYVEFFKKRWHETPNCRGYCPQRECPYCNKRKEKHAG